MFFLSIWPKVESLRHILTAGLQRLAMGETGGALGKVSNVGNSGSRYHDHEAGPQGLWKAVTHKSNPPLFLSFPVDTSLREGRGRDCHCVYVHVITLVLQTHVQQEPHSYNTLSMPSISHAEFYD